MPRNKKAVPKKSRPKEESAASDESEVFAWLELGKRLEGVTGGFLGFSSETRCPERWVIFESLLCL